jgi:hypothetical protein
MSALEWRKMMPAPRLVHDAGMVLVDLDGRSVVFPSEAAARFFYEAYTDVCTLTDEVASLRGWIDEEALHVAKGRVVELSAEVVRLKLQIADLQTRLVAESDVATRAKRHARTLAIALKNKVSLP